MWFSVVYTLIANDTRHPSGQNVLRAPRESTMLDAQSRATFFRHSAVLSLTAVLLRKLPILTTAMTRIVVDKSTHHAKPHSICYVYARIYIMSRNPKSCVDFTL